MSRHCSSVKSVGYDLSFIAPLPQNLTPTRRVNNSPDQMSRDNNCLKFSKPCNGHALKGGSSREPTCLEQIGSAMSKGNLAHHHTCPAFCPRYIARSSVAEMFALQSSESGSFAWTKMPCSRASHLPKHLPRISK